MAKTTVRLFLIACAMTYLFLLLLSSEVIRVYRPHLYFTSMRVLDIFRTDINWNMFRNPKRGLILVEVTAIQSDGKSTPLNIIPSSPFDPLGINSQYWRLASRASAASISFRADLARYLLNTPLGYDFTAIGVRTRHWPISDKPYEKFIETGILPKREIKFGPLQLYSRDELSQK